MEIFTENNHLIFKFETKKIYELYLVSEEQVMIPIENSIAKISIHDLKSLSTRDIYFTDILIKSNKSDESLHPLKMDKSINFRGNSEIKDNDILYSCYVTQMGSIRILNEGFISSKPLLDNISVRSFEQKENFSLEVEMTTFYFAPTNLNIYIRDRKTKEEIQATTHFQSTELIDSGNIMFKSVFIVEISSDILASFISNTINSKLNYFNSLDMYYNFEIAEYTLSKYKFRLAVEEISNLTQEYYLYGKNNKTSLLQLSRTGFGNITIQYYQYDPELLEYVNNLEIEEVKTSNKKPIVLVSEYPESARDNGLSIFKYLINHHKKDFETYYIIGKDNPDIIHLEFAKENIIFSESLKHVDYFIKSDIILHSHSAGYVLPVSTQKMKNLLQQKVRYFIQHGVIGKRDLSSLYGYNDGNFTDYVITSSPRETGILVNNHGFPENRVLEFGLSRFDNLLKRRFNFSKNRNDTKIFVFFTWRPELNGFSETEFLNSNYYKNVMELLNNDLLKSTSGITVYFNLHINMEKYIRLFERDLDNENVILTSSDTTKIIQDYIIESDIMITDYSSAALDFAITKKPVLYYQIDDKPLDESLVSFLPGFILKDEKELNGMLSKQIKSKHINKGIKEKLKDIYLYRDRHASKRLVNHMKKRELKSN